MAYRTAAAAQKVIKPCPRCNPRWLQNVVTRGQRAPILTEWNRPMGTFVVRRHKQFRPRSSPVVLVMGVVMALLCATVGVADAQGRRAEDRQVDLVRPASAVETLRLGCNRDFVDGQRGVLCQWSEATNAHTRGYQLFRVTDGSARELVTTVGVNGRRGFFDTDVSAPSSLVYGVVSFNRSGRLLGRSAPVHVQLGQDIEQLRMMCAADSTDVGRGILCRWSETTQPGARGYLVYRIVGSHQRQVIARIGLDGRNGYFDTDTVPGVLHTYGVTAVDANGDVVAVGGPQQVRWPTAD